MPGEDAELVSIDPVANKLTVLAKDVRPNDLVVTHKGYLYFTETPKKMVTFYNTKTGKMKPADVGITAPNGIACRRIRAPPVVSDFRVNIAGRFALAGWHAGAQAAVHDYAPQAKTVAGADVLPGSVFLPRGRHDHGCLRALLRGYGIGGAVLRSDRPYQRRDSGAAGDQGHHECGVWRPQHGVPYITCFDKIYRMKTGRAALCIRTGRRRIRRRRNS